MDQAKIGRFIAERRKAQGLTQRQLADALSISDKTVSKWECGKGLPEVSLMLPLCGALQITVNDLLTGAVVSETDYRKRAEENMMNLMKENEENKRRMMLSPSCAARSRSSRSARWSRSPPLPRCRPPRGSPCSCWLWPPQPPASLRPPCSTHRPATTSARTAARFSRRRSANT